MTKTCREVYESLYHSKMAEEIHRGATPDKASRRANIFAVKNTVDVWRKQFKRKDGVA